MPKMMPFFTFFGGKYRATRHYPAPTHDLIIEPFAGSAGYSVNHHERDVLLVDLDDNVAETWRYLIGADSDEIRELPDVGEGQKVQDLDIPRGAQHLIGWWLNKGTVTPCQTPSKWMRDGWRPKSFWGPEIRERIASQVPLIRHWRVVEGSYESIPDLEATWFVDPPYAVAGKKYRRGSKGIDYAHLAGWCKERKGQVVVCEAAGADWLPFRPLADIKASSGYQKANVSSEVVYP